MMYPKLSSLDAGLYKDMPEVAGGLSILNMSGVTSQCETNPRLAELLGAALSNQSAVTISALGIPELREKVSARISKLYGHVYSPVTEVTVTADTNQAFYATVAALVSEGDEVILFEPASEAYLPAILLNGGKPVYVSLKEPDFLIDWEGVMRLTTPNTRMIVINTPHNPTGMMLNELDMLRLQKIINGTRIVVLSDERFEHIIFDGGSHQSVSLYPKLAERSVLVNSFSETFNVPAWQVGYCAAPKALMHEIRRVLQVMDSRVFVPFQMALASFITNKEDFDNIRTFYQEKRNLFLSLMEAKTRFIPLPLCGTFYQTFSFKAISDESDKEFAQRLVTDFGVSVVPYSSFFHEKSKKQLLRFNFARPTEVLEEVAERLSKL